MKFFNWLGTPIRFVIFVALMTVINVIEIMMHLFNAILFTSDYKQDWRPAYIIAVKALWQWVLP